MLASATADWASSYGAVAWRAFPVEPGRKKPMFGGWQRDATTDSAAHERWFRDLSRNVGVVAGEQFDCFDVEAAHLPALMAYMKAGNHSLPLTPIADTGRGGRHILVRPLGLGQTRLYLDGVHIGELKSTGGFVVVCPSIVPEGQYTWRFAPPGMTVGEAPDWLRALIAPKPAFVDKSVRQVHTMAEAVRSLDALARQVARTREGNRNNCLYWAARRAAEEGIPAQAVAAALGRAAAYAGCSVAEVEATLRSAFAER